MTTIERQPAGGQYYFIRFSNLKSCVTTDCHFDSDDEKFSGDNYFLSSDQCKACAVALREQFGEELERIAHTRNLNRDFLVKSLREIAAQYKFGKTSEKAKKAELKEVIKGVGLLAEKLAEFESTARELSRRSAEVRAAIQDITAKWPKI